MTDTNRKVCKVCKHRTDKWQRVAGIVHCYDGCHSTTGVDRRTTDGAPAWLPYGNKPAWDKSRMF